MNKNFFHIVLSVGLLLILNSCGNWHPEIRENRANLLKLEKGMSKEKVREIMGEPLVDEVYHKPDFWFYYTDYKWNDGSVTRDECTPIVFEDNKVTGWGWRFYNENYRLKSWDSEEDVDSNDEEHIDDTDEDNKQTIETKKITNPRMQ